MGLMKPESGLERTSSTLTGKVGNEAEVSEGLMPGVVKKNAFSAAANEEEVGETSLEAIQSGTFCKDQNSVGQVGRHLGKKYH